MPTHFHDPDKRMVYLAEAIRLEAVHDGPSTRKPHPELQGWNAYMVVISTGTTGESSRQESHFYSAAGYSRDLAKGLAKKHLEAKAGLTGFRRIDEGEYKKLRAKYLAAAKRRTSSSRRAPSRNKGGK